MTMNWRNILHSDVNVKVTISTELASPVLRSESLFFNNVITFNAFVFEKVS